MQVSDARAGSGHDTKPEHARGLVAPRVSFDAVQLVFLEHPTRRALAEALLHTPGLNKRRAGEAAGVGPKAASFHLERLAAVEVVTLRRSPRGRQTVCLLAADEAMWAEPRTRVLFGGGPLGMVARCIVRRPGVDARGFAVAAGIGRGSARHHAATLTANELTHHYRVGARTLFFPTIALRAWAASMEAASRRDLP